MRHRLKIAPEHFEAIWQMKKTAEMRLNDRDFKVGDDLILREYEDSKYTGNRITVEITHILTGVQYGILPSYCMISFVTTLYRSGNIRYK